MGKHRESNAGVCVVHLEARRQTLMSGFFMNLPTTFFSLSFSYLQFTGDKTQTENG